MDPSGGGAVHAGCDRGEALGLAAASVAGGLDWGAAVDWSIGDVAAEGVQPLRGQRTAGDLELVVACLITG